MKRQDQSYMRWLEKRGLAGLAPFPPDADEAYLAGIAEGRRRERNESAEDARAASIEATWQERQGEDYGSY